MKLTTKSGFHENFKYRSALMSVTLCHVTLKTELTHAVNSIATIRGKKNCKNLLALVSLRKDFENLRIGLFR